MKKHKILDIGCGNNPRKESTHFLDNKKEYLSDLPNAKVWDINKLPLPYDTGEFDEIIADSILEHLDVSIEKILIEFYRILALRGHVKIMVPNFLWWKLRYQYLRGHIPDDFIVHHKKHFTRRYVQTALRNCGFKIIPTVNTLKPDWRGEYIYEIGKKVD